MKQNSHIFGTNHHALYVDEYKQGLFNFSI